MVSDSDSESSSDEAMQDAAPGIGNAAPQHINAAMLGAMQDMLAERDDGLVGVRAELTPDRETLNPVEAAALQQLLATSDSSDSSLLWSDLQTASEKETLYTDEEEYNSDDKNTESTSLFISCVSMGEHVSIGFDITAKNEQFGKLYLYANKGQRSMQFRDYSKFLNFFSLTHEEKKELAGENNFYGIGDIIIKIYATNISMLKHSGNIELITFTSEDLEAIRANICIVVGQRLEFEHTELVTKEAIIDIKTELRMESQRKCAACKEIDTKLEIHTCAQISCDRLNSLLKDALSSVDKWPYSKALVEIYERLADHKEWFKQEFRHSISWNQRMNEVYKTACLPAFMKFE